MCKGGSYAISEILLKGMPFDAYLEKHKIFEKTMQSMMRCLKNWHDAAGDYVAIYTAIFDFDGNCFDDLMR